ncbi:sulfite exporter TauE/SafE family protein [Fulvivirga sp. 29W222]|uniref:Probable membrane transporter protein n=1 Tax=Fulvivirga marina TaxID=2494733 RepID=A0A937FYE1_9BACT|nr:sulfite exporter TauE/SafE family protein [Fulvivirga marina]MBL6448434.1 sulfite exporter TauE/SafE family protein [Fulvivirga marina]
MTIFEIVGYFGAAAIGVSLGLIGGGGSILTVPVLVYLMGVEPVLATAYSLFIVGFSALIGGINYARKGLVSYKTGIVFTIPAFAAVYLTRLLLVPALPDVWLTLGSYSLTKDTGILLLFAFLMVFASVSMIRKKKTQNKDVEEVEPKFNYPMIIIEGLVVGTLTGMVGAGGGFLIIPALVIFAKLPMKMAVGTSLLIIAVKSLIGFIGDIQADAPINWSFLGVFSIIAIVGIFLGSYLAHSIDGQKLKKGFGWFVLVMGAFMIIKELLF